MGLNVGTLVAAVAAAVPEREAVVQGGRRLTYERFLDRSRRLAAVLATEGLGAHGDTALDAPSATSQDLVLLLMTNCPEYLEGMVGGYLARVGPANVNYRYTSTEVDYLVHDSGARAAIVHRRYLPLLPDLDLVLVVEDGSTTPLPSGAIPYEDALAAADPRLADRIDPPPSPDDLYLVYTGGTTGRPKGVLWRQDDFLAGALGVTGSTAELAAAAARRPPDHLRALAAPPLMHGAAHWNAISCLSGGGTVVLQPSADRLDPDAVLDTVAAERCTSLNMVGDAFARPILDADAARPRDLSSLRFVISGGAVLSPEVKQRLVERVPGLRIVDIVGSSESGRQGMASGASSGFDSSPSGVVLDETRSRVLDRGNHTLGWLAASGPIPRGYLGDPEKTAATFPVVGGVRYVVAGDRARWSPDGTIELLGRESQTINTGGEKVFAEEVEEALLKVPAVLDAAVTGRPSERWGQEVVAVVALRPGFESTSDDELREAAAAGGLARYKLPKAIVRVDHVQRTPSGKTDYAWAKSRSLST